MVQNELSDSVQLNQLVNQPPNYQLMVDQLGHGMVFYHQPLSATPCWGLLNEQDLSLKIFGVSDEICAPAITLERSTTSYLLRGDELLLCEINQHKLTAAHKIRLFIKHNPTPPTARDWLLEEAQHGMA